MPTSWRNRLVRTVWRFVSDDEFVVEVHDLAIGEENTRVVDSRASADGFAIRRRRECLACGRRYTTYERIEESPIRVVKKDGAREPFERRKILSGLMKACEKRPVGIEMLDEITTRIDGMERTAEPRRLRSNFINGVKEMQVRFEPGPVVD